MHKPLRLAAISVAVAIAVTSVMDGTGYTAFSALPLCLWMLLFWYLVRVPRREIGFVWGASGPYGLAVFYPVAVMGLIALIAWAVGALDFSHTDWVKAGRNTGLIAVTTVLVALVTEEGFFRGWLFAVFKQAGQSPLRIVVWSSLCFALWHWSWVTLPVTGGALPAWQIPLFLVNAAVIGAVWGMLRLWSGSLLVSSLSHGVWNGLAYGLFGYGIKLGALGIKDTALFGPEVGILGLALNAMFALLLWQLYRRRTA